MERSDSTETNKINIKCKYHSDQKVTYVNVSENASSAAAGKVLLCNDCLSSNVLLSKRLVTIRSILNPKGKTSVNNWPFFEDETLQNLCNGQKEEDINHKIVKQFDKFKSKIVKLMDKLQKKIISNLEQNECNSLLEEVIYNSYLPQLSNIVSQQQSYEELESKLRNFIPKCGNLFQQYEDELLKKTKSVADYEFFVNDIKTEQDEILSKVKSQMAKVDSINDAQQECLLKRLKFQASTLQNCQSYGNIRECDNICLDLQKNQCGYPQIVSDLVLDKSQKYILRVEIETDPHYYYPMIGLIRQSQKDQLQVDQENLCFYANSKGMKKVVKGTSLYELKPKEIEIFISIEDNKLVVTDYPHHKNIMSILDNNCNLKALENLSLGFSIGSRDYGAKYDIKEFYTTPSIPNWVQ